jgi:hypothetical protein
LGVYGVEQDAYGAQVEPPVVDLGVPVEVHAVAFEPREVEMHAAARQMPRVRLAWMGVVAHPVAQHLDRDPLVMIAVACVLEQIVGRVHAQGDRVESDAVSRADDLMERVHLLAAHVGQAQLDLQ